MSRNGEFFDSLSMTYRKDCFFMEEKNYHFETKQLHVGQEQPDPVTDARAVPI